MDELLRRASETYAVAYFAILIVLSLFEWVLPRRAPGEILRLRWWGNFAIWVMDAVVIRSVFPVLGAAWAAYCAAHGWGLFNRVQAPGIVAFVSSVAILDLTAYTQHWVLHRFDLLWRFHRTHHSDQDFDFTTSVRFHPLEAIYTRSFMLGATFLLGPSPGAVVFTELLSMTIAFFEHGNIRLSPALDRVLRWIVITPDMHRIHHSVRAEENSRNFGNIAPWWDRLFGTYLDQPVHGHVGMTLGLPEMMERKHLTLRWMLIQPGLPLAPGEPVEDARLLNASRVQTHN